MQARAHGNSFCGASRVSLVAIMGLVVTLVMVLGLTSVASGQYLASGPTLQEYAPPDLAVGGVLGGYDTDLTTLTTADVIRQEFNAVTCKAFMAYGPWESREQPIDTTGLVRNVNWARTNGMQVHAHVLVYPTENLHASWFQALPDEEVESALEHYVTTMAASTSDDVWVWDVVNEVIGDNGDVMDADGLRMGLGVGEDFVPYKEYEALGAEYVAKAFEWAHAADPNALLIINEYSAEHVNDKSDRLFEFCKKLRDQGVPIDGVGFQNHWLDLRYEPHYDSIRANFQRFADAGFQIFITELDVAAVHSSDPNSQPPTQEELDRQRRVFYELTKLALEQPACKSLLMWDFADESSWLQNTNFTLRLHDRRPGFQDTIIPTGTSMFPTPFSGGDGATPIEKKPAYFGIQAAFDEHPGGVYRMTSGWQPEDSFLARGGNQTLGGEWEPNGAAYVEQLTPASQDWLSLQWRLERFQPGVYRLHNSWTDGADLLTRQPNTNLVTEGLEPGVAVGLQALDETWTSQQWWFVPAGDGGFRLLSGWSPADGCLTREAGGVDAFGNYYAGSELRVYPIEDWSSQIWYFDRIR